MKKKVLAVLLAVGMVVGLFGGIQKEAKADNGVITVPIVVAENQNTIMADGNATFSGKQYLEMCNVPPIGTIFKPGDPIPDTVEDAEMVYALKSDFEYPLATDKFAYVFNEINETVLAMMHTWNELAYARVQNYSAMQDYYGNKIPNTPAGYDGWQLKLYGNLEGGVFILIPYKSVPDTQDCELTVSGGTTTWKDYYGKTVWTITEKEDSINADLSDWAALPDATIKAWKESGKDINVTYLWKGYTVTASVPAGELARTGEAWYGGEYFAKVNEKYVTVKDWFKQPVSIDVLF